jgi:death-on-curing protein
MKNIGAHLKEDYEYSKTLFFERDLVSIDRTCLSIDDMLRAHYLITDYFEHDPYHRDIVAVYGLLNPTMLGSAYGRQFVEYQGAQKYTTSLEKIASLFFGLVKNHAFKDGNKRTALLCLLYHLFKNKYLPINKIEEYENLTVNVAASSYRQYDYYLKHKDEDDIEVKTIANFLKKNTRSVGKTFRSITFQELKQSLAAIGVELSNPNRNFVDLFFSKKRFIGKAEPIKFSTISFPGLKRQVRPETIKKIIADYKKYSGHEIDLDVIYQNSEPMYKMIQHFEGPFMRLKDK